QSLAAKGEQLVTNPFDLKWNKLQSAETTSKMEEGKHIEASVSAGKTIMNIRASLTTLLKGTSESVIVLVRSPTAIINYQKPLERTLAKVFGVDIAEIDGLSRTQGWLDVTENIQNNRVINVGTWTEITQLMNQVMESNSPEARAALREFQAWARDA